MDKLNKSFYDVGISIINYNSSNLTIQCIKTIIEKTSPNLNYHIVLVDNNSISEECLKLKTLLGFAQVTVIESKLNLGFSGGHMLGVQNVDAKYFFFLNNDSMFLNDCLKTLFDFCENTENVGLCGPQMYDESHGIQSCFDYLPTFNRQLFGVDLLRIFKPENYPKRNIQYSNPLKVGLVAGSAMFVNAEVFNNVGGLDTNYFLYCEEEDLAMRIKNLNKDIYLVPAAKNIHFTGKSTIRNFEIEREFYLSYMYMFRKFFSGWQYLIIKYFIFFKLIKRGLFQNSDFLKIAFFVRKGAPMSKSLRFKQTLKSQKLFNL